MKTYKHILASCAALALSLAGGTAFAEGFGEAGQISIQGDWNISIVSRDGDKSDSVTTVTILPALDYFVIPHLSVGGQVGVRHSDSVTDIVLGPRVGYVIGLGKISVWPRVGFDYIHQSGDNDTSASRLTLDLFAPVLFHPVDHFFVGLGPVIDVDFYSHFSVNGNGADGEKFTSIGLLSMVGGYF